MLKKFAEDTKQPKQQQFWGFRGPMARATWAEWLLRGFLRVLRYPDCYQMTNQPIPKAIEGSKFRKFSADAC